MMHSPFVAGLQTRDPPKQIRSAESAFQAAQQLIKKPVGPDVYQYRDCRHDSEEGLVAIPLFLFLQAVQVVYECKNLGLSDGGTQIVVSI